MKKLKKLSSMLISDIDADINDPDLRNRQHDLVSDIVSNGTSVICLFDRDDFRPMYGEICVHKNIDKLHVSENFSFVFNNNYHDMYEYVLHVYLVMKKTFPHYEMIAPVVCNNVAIELMYDDLEKIFSINLGLFEPVSKYYSATIKIIQWLRLKRCKTSLVKMKIRLLVLDMDGFICHDRMIIVLVGRIGNRIIISGLYGNVNGLHHVMKYHSPVNCRYFMVSDNCRAIDVRAAGIVGRSFANPIVYGPTIADTKRDNLVNIILSDYVKMNLYNKLDIRRYRIDDFSIYLNKLDMAKKKTAANKSELLRLFVNGMKNTRNRCNYKFNGFLLDDFSNIKFNINNPTVFVDPEVYSFNIRAFINNVNRRGNCSEFEKKEITDYIDDVVSVCCTENSCSPEIRACMFFFNLLENARCVMHISDMISDRSILNGLPVIGSKNTIELLIKNLSISGFDCYRKQYTIPISTSHSKSLGHDLILTDHQENKTNEADGEKKNDQTIQLLKLFLEGDDIDSENDDDDDERFMKYY